MTNENIDALNDVTKTLIDSQKGYEMVSEMCDDRPALQQHFRRRADERATLINQFQAKVREFGGTPETSGGATGDAHRGFTKFTSAFRDDEKAALDAVDQGEDHLVDEIKRNIDRDGIDAQTRGFLQGACSSARAGEAFSERLSDNYAKG